MAGCFGHMPILSETVSNCAQALPRSSAAIQVAHAAIDRVVRREAEVRSDVPVLSLPPAQVELIEQTAAECGVDLSEWERGTGEV